MAVTKRRDLIQIRSAEPADCRRLAAVQLASAIAAFSHIFPDSVDKPRLEELEAEWEALVNAPGVSVLVADVRAAGGIVAGVGFGDIPTLAPPGYGSLARLYVLPEYSGKGIGTRLYDAAIEQIDSAVWERLWLWVLEGNTRARNMYERRGWMAQPVRRTDWPGSGVFEMGYALELAPSSG